DEKLKKILLHAYNNVPYYHKVLPNAGVIRNGEVDLKNFDKIPVLTKDIIRAEGENLYSRDYKKRKPYENTSGGSTGEPVKLIQDKKYNEWNIATKIYFNQILGKDIGEKEIKFWGSDRDIIEGTIGLKEEIINYLYNRKFFNSYNLNNNSINKLINLHNTFKPQCYWSYTDGMFEFSKIIINRNVKLYTPKFIITSINPLYDNIRETIEKALRCPVYDQYGSREVGPIACQCKEKNVLHIFPWFNFVEVLDDNYKKVGFGKEGKLFITNLRNYSMPLIRYDIGDIAISAEYPKCKCGRNFFSLKKILGRTLGYFKKRDGSLIHSHFIVQQLFFKDWIKRFQIIQDNFDNIIIRIEKRGEPDRKELDDIVKKTRILIGKNCKVEFEFVDEILPSKSGKYLYTICEVEK
ncbi:MAG: hypothetical protein A7315_05995, partial [Candidatus Altiarchaeales archaeon WOR_SM1_79]